MPKHPSPTFTVLEPGTGPRSQEDLDHHLIEVVLANRPEAVRSLVKAGANPNVRHHDHRPVLSLAADHVPRMVDVLLDVGADVDALDSASMTLLHGSVNVGETSVRKIGYWLERGASCQHPNNRFVLHAAAFFGDINVVDLLLKNGADPTVRNSKGQTAAEMARDRRHTSAAERLDQAFRYATILQERDALRQLADTVAPEASPASTPTQANGRFKRL